MTEDQKIIADLQQKLEAAQAAQATAEAKAEAVTKAHEEGAPLPVLGEFKAKVADKDKTKIVKFGFENGNKYIRDKSGNIFNTEGVIQVANEGAPNADLAAQHKNLLSLTKESAQEILQHLVDLKYAGLKEA